MGVSIFPPSHICTSLEDKFKTRKAKNKVHHGQLTKARCHLRLKGSLLKAIFFTRQHCNTRSDKSQQLQCNSKGTSADKHEQAEENFGPKSIQSGNSTFSEEATFSSEITDKRQWQPQALSRNNRYTSMLIILDNRTVLHFSYYSGSGSLTVICVSPISANSISFPIAFFRTNRHGQFGSFGAEPKPTETSGRRLLPGVGPAHRALHRP